MDVANSARSISVRVSLFAALRRYAPEDTDGVVDMTLLAGSTVAAVREALGIPAETEIIVGVDGDQAGEDRALHDGARVVLFNALSGGSGSGG